MLSLRLLAVCMALLGLTSSVFVSLGNAQVQALPPYTAMAGPGTDSVPPPVAYPPPVAKTPVAAATQPPIVPGQGQLGSPSVAPGGSAVQSPSVYPLPENRPPLGVPLATQSWQQSSPLQPAQYVEIDQSGPYYGAGWGSGFGALPSDSYCWQLLPDGLLYKSYLAGGRESRIGSTWLHERDRGWLWDVTLGGRVGMVRYGTTDSLDPQGWQLDIEGAAFPRLDIKNGRDLVSTDFRFGVPLTHRAGRWQSKFGYYHLSSHLGDEYMVSHHTFDRINYVRDSLVLGLGFFPNPDVRLYAEAAWAFYINGGAEPWEFQFGVDYSPAEPTGCFPAPFFAVNGRLREENDYGGNFTMETGLQWRGQSGHLLRMGAHYFIGMSDQYQFFNQFEEQIGMGVWYDY